MSPERVIGPSLKDGHVISSPSYTAIHKQTDMEKRKPSPPMPLSLFRPAPFQNSSPGPPSSARRAWKARLDKASPSISTSRFAPLRSQSLFAIILTHTAATKNRPRPFRPARSLFPLDQYPLSRGTLPEARSFPLRPVPAFSNYATPSTATSSSASPHALRKYVRRTISTRLST